MELKIVKLQDGSMGVLIPEDPELKESMGKIQSALTNLNASLADRASLKDSGEEVAKLREQVAGLSDPDLLKARLSEVASKWTLEEYLTLGETLGYVEDRPATPEELAEMGEDTGETGAAAPDPSAALNDKPKINSLLEYLENRLKSVQGYKNHDSLWYGHSEDEMRFRGFEIQNTIDVIRDSSITKLKEGRIYLKAGSQRVLLIK
jgi:hypothetical protein